MSVDMTLLRLARNRQDFNKLAPGLPEAGLEETTVVMWKAVADFYKEFPKVDDIDMPTFKTWFIEFKHQAMPIDKLDMYGTLITSMAKPVPEGMREGLMDRMLQAELSVQVMDAVEAHTNGAEIDLDVALGTILDEYTDRFDRQTESPEVTDDIDDLMAQDEKDGGISWRLHALRNSMRPMRPGDFGVWAGRPDRGKTTTLVSECSHWITQLDREFPGENRVGIWFNNEGPGARIKQRYFQAALGKTTPEMVEMHKAGTLRAALHEALGPDLTRMKFFDVHDYYSHEVEAILKQHKPAFVIFDMIDNIKFSGLTANNGQRTDQILEEMYKWGRNLAVKYGFSGFATSQVSGDGDGVPYPPQAALKDSKTGKQGACDFIVIWGAVNDPNMDNLRYLGIPKNKLHRPGGKKNPQCEVIFDAERARLRDPED